MSNTISGIKRGKRCLTSLLLMFMIVNMLLVGGQALVFAADMVNNEFTIQVDNASGGVYILKKTNDGYDTNYVINPTSNPNFNIDDSRWFGDLTFRYRLDGGEWIDNVTSLSDDVRTVTQNGNQITVSYLNNSAHTYGIKNMQVIEQYTLDSNYMRWDITVKNTSGRTLEIGDLGIPLNFNHHWNSTQDVSYTQRVVRHSFVSKNGSYIVWGRPNGVGPYLIMFPVNGTSLEFKDMCRRNEGPFAMEEPRFEGLVTYFINSLWVSQNRAGAYLPATSTILPNGASKTFSFKFRWCTDEAAVQDILYQEGLIDVTVAPGMTTTTDLPVSLDLHTKKNINSVTAQYPAQTSITRIGSSNDHNIYRISFSRLGQNNITVNYGNNETTVLQFYVIEPLETLINNRAQFLVNRQQENNPSKGWYKAFMQWDMLNKRTVTRETWNPSGEWMDWHTGGSDDLGFA
ncbi:MAG: LamG domain-containing protein, partial [Clostridiaceae bacterium]|nr:LamG domain-containing protein [Clostridiaceae bacterium]